MRLLLVGMSVGLSPSLPSLSPSTLCVQGEMLLPQPLALPHSKGRLQGEGIPGGCPHAGCALREALGHPGPMSVPNEARTPAATTSSPSTAGGADGESKENHLQPPPPTAELFIKS